MKLALDRSLVCRIGMMSTMLCSLHGAASGARPRDPAELAERPSTGSSLVYREEAVIAAPAERVWDTLVDLPRYAEWNPWLLHAEGDLSPGGVVRAEVLLGKR